jgi:hypothetical protein
MEELELNRFLIIVLRKNDNKEVGKVTLPLGPPFTHKPLLQSQTLLSTK